MATICSTEDRFHLTANPLPLSVRFCRKLALKITRALTSSLFRVSYTGLRLARAQFLKPAGTRARPFRPQTNQFQANPGTASYFPVLVSELLHKFMTIFSIKVGQWLGPLHPIFVLGLFSHGTSVCSSAPKRYSNHPQPYPGPS